MNVAYLAESYNAEFAMTNRGLSITTVLWSIDNSSLGNKTTIMVLSCVDEVIVETKIVPRKQLLEVSLMEHHGHYYRNSMALVYIDPLVALEASEDRGSLECLVSSRIARGERHATQGFWYKHPTTLGLFQTLYNEGCPKDLKVLVLPTNLWRGANTWFVCPKILCNFPEEVGKSLPMFYGSRNRNGSVSNIEQFQTWNSTTISIVLVPSKVCFIPIPLAGPSRELLAALLRMTDQLTPLCTQRFCRTRPTLTRTWSDIALIQGRTILCRTIIRGRAKGTSTLLYALVVQWTSHLR